MPGDPLHFEFGVAVPELRPIKVLLASVSLRWRYLGNRRFFHRFDWSEFTGGMFVGVPVVSICILPNFRSDEIFLHRSDANVMERME